MHAFGIFNPRRAARVTVIGLRVFLSVYDYSHTTGYKAAYERYQQLQCYKGMKKSGDVAEMTAFEKYGMKTSKKVNKHNEHWLTSTKFSPFSAPWTN